MKRMHPAPIFLQFGDEFCGLLNNEDIIKILKIRTRAMRLSTTAFVNVPSGSLNILNTGFNRNRLSTLCYP
jgi:hypothetical protein